MCVISLTRIATIPRVYIESVLPLWRLSAALSVMRSLPGLSAGPKMPNAFSLRSCRMRGVPGFSVGGPRFQYVCCTFVNKRADQCQFWGALFKVLFWRLSYWLRHGMFYLADTRRDGPIHGGCVGFANPQLTKPIWYIQSHSIFDFIIENRKLGSSLGTIYTWK